MTGFGLAVEEYRDQRITAEVKCLNSKFLDISVKLPRSYMQQEMTVRTEAQRYLERGKVSVVISLERITAAQARPVNIDYVLLEKYYTDLSRSAAKLGAVNTNLFEICLGMPQVIGQSEEEGDPAEWERIHQTLRRAMEAAGKFRIDEGKVLEDDIRARIGFILQHLAVIESTDHGRLPLIKEKIHTHLLQAISSGSIDENRLEQEMVYFVERLDITEEKLRLKSHCDYFLANLTHSESPGKKLGFIGQEIGREINTLGSKVNDALIQQRIVLMKDELEKIKEQLLNIL